MSNIRYLEIDSTYRDRTLWPLPGQFEIPISQTGRKGKLDAVDPVSAAAPVNAWKSNQFLAITGGATITATLETTGAGLTNTRGIFIISSAVAGEFQQEKNYYSFSTITDTGTGETKRIVSYRYLGNDKAQITTDTPFSANISTAAGALSISDPTDISDTSNPLIYVPAGRLGEDAYIGCFLYNETLKDYRPISYYSFETHLLTLDTSASSGGPVAGWTATDNYSIRKEAPSIVSGTTAASTTTSIVLTDGVTEDNYYIGDFIRVIPAPVGSYYNNTIPAPVTETRRIVAYNGATQTATVSPPFSASVGAITAPLTNRLEILNFSYDNLNPFVYNGSLVSQQEMVCYEIELLNLVLPNDTLVVGSGSRIAFYPFVYVELRNISGASSGNKNIIYSNNPYSTSVLFRAVVDDISNQISSSFIKLDGDGAVQTIKFKPNDNLKFTVKLPNGDIYNTIIEENFSPYAPKGLGQVSAFFSLKRL